jgi:hypothetical protein
MRVSDRAYDFFHLTPRAARKYRAALDRLLKDPEFREPLTGSVRCR